MKLTTHFVYDLNVIVIKQNKEIIDFSLPFCTVCFLLMVMERVYGLRSLFLVICSAFSFIDDVISD